MVKLTEENITGTVLKHMIHCEDLLLRGSAGCRLAVKALEAFLNRIESGASEMTITQKIDGAPAVVAASDFYGDTFVALKHSWDKGKVFRTSEEIVDAFSDRPELASKLQVLLKYLPLIEIPENEIWMGDYLYSNPDLQEREINGTPYLTFCPNTLVYAIPVDSPLAKKIRRTEIGITWHTRYSGPKDHLSMSFNVSVNELQNVPAIFQMDAALPENLQKPLTGDLEDCKETLALLKARIQELSDPAYQEICADPKLVLLLDTFRNSEIRKGNETLDYQGLMKWINDRFAKEAESKKTERGKALVNERRAAVIEKFPEETITEIYRLQDLVVSVKEQLISLQNKQMPIQTFIEKTDGTLEPAAGEGFAVSDIDGNIQKMVSRLGFSAANFSPDVKKGWMSDKRNRQESLTEAARIPAADAQQKMDIIDDIMDDLKAQTATEDKRDPKFHPLANQAEYTLMPTPENPNKREASWQTWQDLLQTVDTPLENPKAWHKGTTPVIEADIPVADSSLLIQFKDISASRGDAKLTEIDELFWGWCIAMAQNGNQDINHPGLTLPETKADLETMDMSFLNTWGADTENLSFQGKVGYFDGFIEGSKEFCQKYLVPGRHYLVFRVGVNKDEVIDVYGSTLANLGNLNLHSEILKAVPRCLPKGFAKDSWNPADLIVCAEDFCEQFKAEWRSLLELPGQERVISRFNDYLKDCLLNRDLICVSLKDTTRHHISEVNMDPSERICKTGTGELLEVKVPLCGLLSKLSKTGRDRANGISFKIQATNKNGQQEIYKGSYRIFSGMTTMQMDITPTSSASRLGKVPKSFIKLFYDQFGLEDEKDFSGSRLIMETDPLSLIPEIRELVSSPYAGMFGVQNLEQDFRQMVADKESEPENLEDLRLYYTWPRNIDFLVFLKRAMEQNRAGKVLTDIILAAGKEYEGCAPYVKIY